MALSRAPSESGERQVSVEFIFDPAAEGITMPDDTWYVLAPNSATGFDEENWDKAPELEEKGGRYIFRGNLTVPADADKIEYRFVIRNGGSNIYVPSLESGRNKSLLITAEGVENAKPPRDTSHVTHRTRGRVDDVLGKTSPLEPDAPAVHADSEELVDVSDVGVDVETVRQQSGEHVKRVFREGGELLRNPDRKKAGAVLAEIVTESRSRKEQLLTGAPDAREFLRSGLNAEIEEAHADWVEKHSEAPQEARELLQTSAGRLKFRAVVFNVLCEKNIYGLKPKHRVGKIASEEEFDQILRKRLKRNKAAFDRICSRFDGGNIRRLLTLASEGIDKEVVEGDEGIALGDLQRKLRKHKGKVTRRVKKELGGVYSENAAYGKMEKFLATGGDIALKIAAIIFLTAYPMPSVLAWGARSISEAMGYDFGQVLKATAKFVPEMGKRGAKGLINLLPNSLLAKLPEGFQDWLEKPNMPLLQRVDRANYSLGERSKRFWRNLLPLPALLNRIPYVEKIVPDVKDRPGAITQEASQALERDITDACQTSLRRLSGKISPESAGKSAKKSSTSSAASHSAPPPA